MVTYLEPNTPECEVKGALGIITTNKASGGDRIPAELFKIVKDDTVSSAFKMSAKLENSGLTIDTGKGQFSFQSQRKIMPKDVQTTIQLHSFPVIAR